MAADPLASMLSQVVHDLSFSQTHTVSEDFRVYPKTSIDSVYTLQQEQRKRVEQTYGARAPSPDFLGSQLLAEYRSEAASQQLADESGDPNFPTFLSRLTREQRKQFKKDMKQRIHEWEGAVQEVTGQPHVNSDQKASLLPIYELYRAVRRKTLGLEPPAASWAGSTEPSVAGVGRDASPSATPSAGWAAAPSAAASKTEHTRLSASTTEDSAATSLKNAYAAGTSENRNASVPAVQSSTAASSDASVSNSGGYRAQRSELELVDTEDVTKLPDDVLLKEKRKLKYLLHGFESRFEKQYGVRPGRDDRRGFTAGYRRYGELKNELARRAEKH